MAIQNLIPPPPVCPANPHVVKETPASTIAMLQLFSSLKRPEFTQQQLDSLLENYTPTYFFFYGLLMDPDVLQDVLQLPNTPTLEQGCRVKGFNSKMWGIYPTIIPLTESKIDSCPIVNGCIFKINTVRQVELLSCYETSAYKLTDVTICRSDGSLIDGKTFSWADQSRNVELADGAFDLERFQKYFKSYRFARQNMYK